MLALASGMLPVCSHLSIDILTGHRCRFTIVEAKAILFTIFRHFEVELAVEPDDIVRRVAIVGRPTIADSPHEGVQLPILIRPVKSTQ